MRDPGVTYEIQGKILKWDIIEGAIYYDIYKKSRFNIFYYCLWGVTIYSSNDFIIYFKFFEGQGQGWKVEKAKKLRGSTRIF